MANTPAIRNNAVNANNEFVFRPGSPGGGNIFPTWAECYTAARSYPGMSMLRVDTSLNDAVVAGGTWDMSGIQVGGFNRISATGPADTLQLGEGCVLENMETFVSPMRVRNMSSSPSIVVSGQHSIVAHVGVIFEAPGGPMIEVQDGAQLILTMLGGSQLTGGSPVVELAGSSTLVVQLFSGSMASFNTVTGTAALVSVSIFGSGSSFDSLQTGLTTTPAINLITQAEYEGYDNSLSGLAATNVQDAIDELSGSTSSSGTLGQRTYGNVFVVWNEALAPLTVNDLTTLYGVKRGNVDLLNSTPSYAGCRWRMEFITSTPPTVFDNLTFSTAQDIVDWVNANVPQVAGRFTQDVQVSAYDVVDPQIEPLFKVMGKNRTFSRFRDIDKYWSPGGETVSDGFADFLNGLWTTVWGDPIPTGNPPATWVDEFRLFWVPQNHRRLYLLPNRGFEMDLTQNLTSGARQMIRVSDDTLQTASVAEWTTDAIQEPQYGAMDPSGTLFEYFTMREGHKSLPRAILNGMSTVIGYPMVDPDGNRGLYLKPVGIDVFHTNWFDDSQYQLEAVGVLDRDGQARIRTLSPETTPQAVLNSGGLYALSNFAVPLAFPNGSTQRGGTFRPGEVRFQLRDLATNRVSPFSNPKIGWDFKKRFRPLAALVRNDATR